MAEVARVGDAVWREDAPRLPESADELDQLFGAAWEDGLVAIGLLAACWSDDPEGALDQGLDWATRIDDIVSADALGWFVLGPVAMVTQQIGTLSSRLRSHPRDAVRRCAIMAAMAWTTSPLEGPAAAPLRAKLNQKKVRMVDASQSQHLADYLLPSLNDASPSVRKAQRRVVRAWANDDPAGVVAFGARAGGGLPKLLRSEVQRASRMLEREADPS